MDGVLLLKIMQTKKVLEASKQTTLIDLERILVVRQPYSSDFYLNNLEKGLAGEEKVLAFLKRYGNSNWEGIRNIWLNNNGKFECDMLLLANAGAHMFEIKHYDGQFVYRNGDCILNNKVLADNPITQAQRNFRKFKNIVQKFDSRLKVYGTLIFIGAHNTVEIHSPVSDISIVKQTELKNHILKIVEADRNQLQQLNTNSLLSHLEKYEVNNPFVPEPLGHEAIQSLRRGIYCEKCQNFQITMSKLYIHCNCGYKERREKGILRTIHEYSAITGKKKITLKEAKNFINDKASDKYLTKIMKKHLTRVRKGKYTYYVIEPIPYYKKEYSTE